MLLSNLHNLLYTTESDCGKAETPTTKAGTNCEKVLPCTANVWAVTGKIKTSATKAPRHQEFFYNNPLGVPLCLRAFVAIFTAGESVFKKRRLKWQFQ